jgi:hypothetical protein
MNSYKHISVVLSVISGVCGPLSDKYLHLVSHPKTTRRNLGRRTEPKKILESPPAEAVSHPPASAQPRITVNLVNSSLIQLEIPSIKEEMLVSLLT